MANIEGLGSRGRGRCQQPLPDDGGEELSGVDVGDGKSSSCGELPHDGQHSAHDGQIW